MEGFYYGLRAGVPIWAGLNLGFGVSISSPLNLIIGGVLAFYHFTQEWERFQKERKR